MPSDSEWAALLAAAAEPAPIVATRLLGPALAGSYAAPHPYQASTPNGLAEWAVKFPKPGQLRALIADQVLGMAGQLVGAAVGDYAAIEISPALVPSTGDPSWSGIGHASRLIPNATDRMGVDHVDSNRERWASLTVFYTWTGASDHQVIFEQTRATSIVYSVDHGHFLPNAENWTAASLDADAGPVALEPWIVNHGISPQDCGATGRQLLDVTPEQVSATVRAARDVWGASAVDRLSLCRYLWRRRHATLRLLGI